MRTQQQAAALNSLREEEERISFQSTDSLNHLTMLTEVRL